MGLQSSHKEMAPDYAKNCILKGTVDFYCLVCETYLRSEADNIAHIARPIHKKNLDIIQYVKDFEEDFVKKIKQGYFCELCNKLFPTMSRVKLHVKELSHNDRKTKMFFKRIGLNVIAFGKVVLNDKAWNGLNDESCAFCNIEYENEEIHKSLKSHILNIIRIKVEVDENKNIYRKIDDHSFQCLTCNMVLALNNISSHFEDEQHKLLYQKCCVVIVNKINKNESVASEDLKKINFKNEIKDLSGMTNNLANSINETEINTEQAHTTKGSDVHTEFDNDETSPIDATLPFNQVGENEKKSKTLIGAVVEQDYENLKDNIKICVTNTSNETAENIADVLKNSDVNKIECVEDKNEYDKPTSKQGQGRVDEKVNINEASLKDETKELINKPSETLNVNKINKNLEDRRVRKSEIEQKLPELKETKKLEISNLNSKITRNKSNFNVEEYEKKICKILRTDNYITLDENGKTLCILCDWIMDPKNKKNHIAGQHHQTMEKLHKRRLAEMRYNDKKENIVVQNKSIIDSVNKFQANNININLISNTAACKKCTVSLPYDVTAIEEHILKHNNETDERNVKIDKNLEDRRVTNSETEQKPPELNETKTIGTIIKLVINTEQAHTTKGSDVKTNFDNEETSAFDATIPFNQIVENEKKSKTSIGAVVEQDYENLKDNSKFDVTNTSNKTVENTTDVLKNSDVNKTECVEDKNEYDKPTSEHGQVDENMNKNEASLKDETKELIIKPSEKTTFFKQLLGYNIKSLKNVKNMMFNDVIINDQICISLTGFEYLFSTNGAIKCLACDAEVNDIETHIHTFEHVKLLNETLVIIHDKSEFIREIIPELLHCGFCNIICKMQEHSWSEMQEHLNSSSHIENKNASEWRLQTYLDQINAKNYDTTSFGSELSIRNMFSGLF